MEPSALIFTAYPRPFVNCTSCVFYSLNLTLRCRVEQATEYKCNLSCVWYVSLSPVRFDDCSATDPQPICYRSATDLLPIRYQSATDPLPIRNRSATDLPPIRYQSATDLPPIRYRSASLCMLVESRYHLTLL